MICQPHSLASETIYVANCYWNTGSEIMGKGKGGNPNYPSTTGKPSGKGRGNAPK